MDRLRTMEVFLRVVELGSFTRAAASLRLPRATVTAAIQELEADVGVQLLHRTTRRVAPTAEGSRYYRGLTGVLANLAELEADVGRASTALTGRIRVDVPASAGRHVIAPELPDFLALHPGLVIEIGSTDRPVDLRAEGVDLVLRGGEVHDPSLSGRRLGALPVGTFAAPAYLRAHGAPSRPDELEQHVFIGFFSPRTGAVFEVDGQRDGRMTSFRPRYSVAANDADTWIALAVAGLGIVQCPISREIRARVARGELVPLFPGLPTEPLPLWILWPKDRHMPARVRAFVDWLADLYTREVAEAEGAMVLASGSGVG